MPIDPQTLLRSFGKLVAVVLAAGVAGVAIGLVLSELTGSGNTDTQALPVPTGGTSTSSTTVAETQTTGEATTTQTQATPAETTTTTTQTTTTGGTSTTYRVPRVEVLSADLGTPSPQTGQARVSMRIRVTNRGARLLDLTTPVLISDADEVPLDGAARDAAGPLVQPLGPAASATGVLRFTLQSAITQRLIATPQVRLRIARRTISVELMPLTPPAAPPG